MWLFSASTAAMAPVKKLVVKGARKWSGFWSSLWTALSLQKTEPRTLPILSSFFRRESNWTEKAGHLGGGVVTTGRNRSKVTVTSEVAFSKRHLKYLTKKYLNRHHLRDRLRLVANSKGSHELCYFQINQDGEEGED